MYRIYEYTGRLAGEAPLRGRRTPVEMARSVFIISNRKISN